MKLAPKILTQVLFLALILIIAIYVSMIDALPMWVVFFTAVVVWAALAATEFVQWYIHKDDPDPIEVNNFYQFYQNNPQFAPTIYDQDKDKDTL